MTQNIRDVLKLAFEALEELYNTNSYWWQEVDEQTLKKIEHSITAIEEALAQAQEPFAYYHPHKSFYFAKPTSVTAPITVDVEPLALYTAPPQRSESSGKPSAWVDLTDEEIDNINYTSAHMLARKVLAKFKEKNT